MYAIQVFVSFQPRVQFVPAADLVGENGASHAAGRVEGEGEKTIALYGVDYDAPAGSVRLEHNAAERTRQFHGPCAVDLRKLFAEKVGAGTAGDGNSAFHRDQPRKFRTDRSAESDGAHAIAQRRTFVKPRPQGEL